MHALSTAVKRGPLAEDMVVSPVVSFVCCTIYIINYHLLRGHGQYHSWSVRRYKAPLSQTSYNAPVLIISFLT